MESEKEKGETDMNGNEVINRIDELKKSADSIEQGIAEQIIDMVIDFPQIAKTVGEDLNENTLSDIAAKLQALADKKHEKSKGKCVRISPKEAEDIIKEHFGLGEGMKRAERAAIPEDIENESGDILNMDFEDLF